MSVVSSSAWLSKHSSFRRAISCCWSIMNLSSHVSASVALVPPHGAASFKLVRLEATAVMSPGPESRVSAVRLLLFVLEPELNVGVTCLSIAFVVLLSLWPMSSAFSEEEVLEELFVDWIVESKERIVVSECNKVMLYIILLVWKEKSDVHVRRNTDYEETLYINTH